MADEKVTSAESITVGMRMRPLIGRERDQKHCIKISGNVVSIVEGALSAPVGGKTEFAFDYAMDSSDLSSPDCVTASKCYDLMGKRMKDHMMQGYNTCLFCYGQTGTGKTTTIMGKMAPVEEQGLLLRLITDIFTDVERMRGENYQVTLKLQMLEVYNEKLTDLLAAPDRGVVDKAKKKIDVHVHPDLGVYLTGASEEVIESAAKCLKLIDYGNSMKTVHATAMNSQSSRGHTVIKINMERSGGSEGLTLSSEVYFADLAGRENEKTTQVTGDRLVELSFINRSLMWLTTCIQALGGESAGASKRRATVAHGGLPGMQPRRGSVMPDSEGKRTSGGAKKPKYDLARFRNSKLTLLLSNALSGNSRTAMIGTLSPAVDNFEESHSTLKFAATVKNIKLEATAATAVDKDALVKKLEKEVEELRKRLQQADVSTMKEDLAAELAAREGLADNFRMTKNSAIQSAQRDQLRELKMKQFGFNSSDTKYPCISNYSDDPHLAFLSKFHIPPDGQEKIVGSGDDADFTLSHGLGISSRMCAVRNDGASLWIQAVPRSPRQSLSSTNALVEVNDKRVEDGPVELRHLDLVLFGRSTKYYVLMHELSASELDDVFTREREATHPEAGDVDMAKGILGEDRSKDQVQLQQADEYVRRLRELHQDSDGRRGLHSFLEKAEGYRKLVDEANDITQELRPSERLLFELVAHAPVLAFGFTQGGSASSRSRNCLPELGVQLVHHESPAKARWNFATNRVALQSGGMSALAKILKGPGEEEMAKGTFKLMYTWTWSKFMSRLDLMRSLRQDHEDDPGGFKLDPHNDPWAEYGPGELDEIKNRHREELEELHEVRNIEVDSLRMELEAVRQQLQAEKKINALRRDSEPLGFAPSSLAQLASSRDGGQDAEARDDGEPSTLTRLTALLEQTRKNQVLVQSLQKLHPPQAKLSS